MTDEDFREKVVESLARIEGSLDRQTSDIKGIQLTLFGEDRCGGLVKGYGDLKHASAFWTRILGVLSALSVTISGVLAYLKWGGK